MAKDFILLLPLSAPYFDEGISGIPFIPDYMINTTFLIGFYPIL